MSESAALQNVLLTAIRQAARGIIRDFGELERLQNAPDSVRRFAVRGRENARDILMDELHHARPAYGWIDEQETINGKDSNRYWAVDPLSGLNNFTHAVPQIALVAAVLYKGEPELTIMYNPISQELYTAQRNRGVLQEKFRLRVSTRTRAADSLIAVTMPAADADAEMKDLMLMDVKRVVDFGAAPSGTGCPALDLAWVAAGRYDAAWLRGGRTVTAVACSLLVREAGGRITLPPADATATAGTLATSEKMHVPLTQAFA